MKVGTYKLTSPAQRAWETRRAAAAASAPLQMPIIPKPVRGASMAQTIKLFLDQQGAVDEVLGAYHAGEKSVLIQEPTGAGKTIVALWIMQAIGLPTVFLVHRDELVNQTVAKLQMVAPGLTVGVVKAERNELGYDLTVASAQTLAREKRLETLVRSLPAERLLIVDEAHHAVADTWIRTIERIDAKFVLGMTATAYRADKKALGQVFGRVAHQTPILTLIAGGRLKNPVGVRIDTETDLDGVHTRGGDFADGELASAVDTDERDQLVVDSWKEHRVWNGQEFKRPIAFCVTVKHAEHLRDKFRDNGFACEMVVGETPTDERARIFREFHEGKCYMTSVGVLTEGWDEPLADAVLMARPTKSLGLWVQMVGRVLRAAPGQDHALVMDFVDSTSKHSLITLPTLAGHEAQGDEDSDEAETDDREVAEPLDFLSMVQKIAKVRKLRAIEVSLFGESTYVWAKVNGLFMTEAGNDEYLALLPDETGDLFLPVEITNRGDQPVMRRLFDRPLEIAMAMNVAEQLVPMNKLTDRSEGWRQAPSSPRQRFYARDRLGLTIPRQVSRGEAAGMIVKAKFSQLVDRPTFDQAARRLVKTTK